MMAGADRVEGCLFGHGERTGNVCLVTLGMNLFSQGIDPQIDFSDIDEIRRTVEWCTQLPVHPRHPYAGDLVYTAFSGSHQDAIKKGLEDLDRQAAEQGVPVGELPWEAPYLPIDPKDVGRTYEAVIRVNSQSGKGGVAYVLKAEHKLDLPRRAQIEFSRVIQERTDTEGGEITPGGDLGGLPRASTSTARRRSGSTRCTPRRRRARRTALDVNVYVDGELRELTGEGNGPIAAFVNAINELSSGRDGTASTSGSSTTPSTRCRPAATPSRRRTSSALRRRDQVLWGVGLDANIVTASLKAVISAVNRG